MNIINLIINATILGAAVGLAGCAADTAVDRVATEPVDSASTDCSMDEGSVCALEMHRLCYDGGPNGILCPPSAEAWMDGCLSDPDACDAAPTPAWCAPPGGEQMLVCAETLAMVCANEGADCGEEIMLWNANCLASPEQCKRSPFPTWCGGRL